MIPQTILGFLFLLVTAPNPGPRSGPEPHLSNIRQLTFGGTNAEAYFSFGETQLVFQSTRPPYGCDQIYRMSLDGTGQTLVSTGRGRTTCAFFFPGDKRILYASTHLQGDSCPPQPDKSKGYVWGVFDAYDIYSCNLDGSDLRVLTASPGYDAEATISPRQDRIVFTSSRDGDLELYTMNLDGTGIHRITHTAGYDGGANFSWDGQKIVFRGFHPSDSVGRAEYRTLLSEELVKPTTMEIFICDADGKDMKQLTHNGAANFAPIFFPDNRRIMFSSNMEKPGSRYFDLYTMNIDGSHLERVTYTGNFNSFPMFTHDGKKLVFVSDRAAKSRYEFNVFLANWAQ